MWRRPNQLLILGALTLLFAGEARAQLTLLGAGHPPGSGGGGGYTGEGDVVGSAAAWFSLATAYNAAFATPGTNVSALLTRNDTHTCKTLIATNGLIGNTTQCSTGGDNGTTLATWMSGHTAVCTTLYDQSGNGLDVACQNSPPVVLSFANSLPCIQFVHASTMYANNLTALSTFAQPLSMTGVAESVSNNNGTIIFTNTSAAAAIGLDGTADNQAFLFAGSVLPAGAADNDNTLHGVIGVANGGSSRIKVDNNTTTTGSGGTNGVGTGLAVGGSTTGTTSLDGYLCSAGLWVSTGFTSGQENSINSVQATNFGIP